MTNLEKLKSTRDKKDLVLASFIEKRGQKAVALVNSCNEFNRGCFLENAITLEPCKNDGLHTKSKGDFVLNGVNTEIKYITKKTGGSSQLRGTTATHYLIAFNDSEKIEVRLIPLNEIETKPDFDRYGKPRNKITYQLNFTKGEKIDF